MSFIELNDGVTLYPDGSIVCSHPEKVVQLRRVVPNPTKVYINEITPDVLKYNRLVEDSKRIKSHDKNFDLDFDWDIPVEYSTLDVLDYVLCKQAEDPIVNWTKLPELEKQARSKRLQIEYDAYQQSNMLPLLRTLIFITDTLKINDVCWGVGRGSSVASYLLFILGVHDIDSFKFKLPLTDFFRSKKEE